MNLEYLIYEVQRDHELRMLECKTLPKQRRGKRTRRRPNTALISEAAESKMLLCINVEPRMTDVVDRTVPPLRRGA